MSCKFKENCSVNEAHQNQYVVTFRCVYMQKSKGVCHLQLQSSFQAKMYQILYCREKIYEAIHKQLIIRQSRNNNKTKQGCLTISWNTLAFFGLTKTKQGLCHSLSVKATITTKQSKGVGSSRNYTK